MYYFKWKSDSGTWYFHLEEIVLSCFLFVQIRKWSLQGKICLGKVDPNLKKGSIFT